MPHVQIRNVPDDVHRTLKARAAKAGMSLSDYLLEDLRRHASLPTPEEWAEEARSSRHRVGLRSRPAAGIRDDRESR